MELDINQELRSGYEEALFDLEGYKSEHIKSCKNKIEKYHDSLELRLAFAQDYNQSIDIDNTSLQHIMFHVKHLKSKSREYKFSWFSQAMWMWQDGWSFDGMFFRKGEEKKFYKRIVSNGKEN